MKKIHIPNTGPPVSIDRPHARGMPTGDTGTRVFLTAHSTAHLIPAGLHVLIPNLQGFGNLEGLKSCWLGTQTLTGQKDAVRFTKKVAVLDLTASARPVNVDCTGLKSSCRARDPAVHPPEKVCRSGTGMERARDGTSTTCWRKDSPTPGARDGTANMGYLIPEGLHVYSQLVGRENTTPGGVELSVPHYLYKHLIPAWSADRSLKTCADIGPGRRKSAASRPVHPPEWEWYGEKKTGAGRPVTEDERNIPVQVLSNPAGLHVYRKTNKGADTTPAGVEQLSALHYFYKHSIPLESFADIGPGRRKSAASRPVHPPEWEWYVRGIRKCRITNNESGRKNPVQGCSIPVGLHVYSQTVSRENSTPAGVVQTVISYRFYKHLMPLASGKNIPVLRTSGYNADSNSTNINGATHLSNSTNINGATHLLPIALLVRVSQPAATPRNTQSGNRRIWNEKPAAEPRKICRNGNEPSGMKVQRTETLTENEEYKIANNESERKIPVKGRLIPEGLHVYRKAVNMVNSTPAGVAQIVISYRFYKHLMPLASGKPGNKPTWMKLHSALSANRSTEILNGNTPQDTPQDNELYSCMLGDKLGDRLGDRLGDNQKRMLEIIGKDPQISLSHLSKKIGISQTAVENNISKLKRRGIIKRIGPAKGGYWQITENK